MSKEITTEMLLDMIEKTGWEISSRDSIVRVDTVAHNMELQRKVADLEAKLTEYKEQVEIVEKQHSELLMTIFDGHKENFELKQQLAEKEKEIEELTECNQYLQIYRNQDKISFCIEQLEKVRTQFRTKYSWYEETHRVCEKTDDFIIWLDNQIEELKKENRDENR